MSDRPEPGEPEPANGDNDDERDAAAVHDLLKRSFAADEENAPDLLVGVQRRIRHRSRGKFFADGWSTTHVRISYALIGMITVLLVLLSYYLLSPMIVR